MPLTSIQCWHVHCEECWLRTLVKWSGGWEWVAFWITAQMSVLMLEPAWGENEQGVGGAEAQTTA